jgi:hypothetical protein
VDLGKLLEVIRDRVVHRSQIGKRKLDRSAARRRLDLALRDLGERYHALAAAGTVTVPPELTGLVDEVRRQEERLAVHDAEIAALKQDHPSTT